MKSDASGDFAFVEGPTADLSFVAHGATLEALFTAAAGALLAATVDDPAAVEPAERHAVSFEEPDLELLLLRLLSELVFLRDARGLLLRVEAIEVAAGPPARLAATLAGARLDRQLHALRSEVKAATAHGLRVARVPAGWEARVTLDV